jgi:hypothetical protein
MDMIASIVPAARFEGLVMSEVGGETLVYDEASHHIHHLNEASATVWRQCDGTSSVAAIALSAGMSDVMVRVAVAKLAGAGLLRDELGSDLRGSAQSRRAFMKKAAIAGTIPAIVSVTAPLAAQAASATTLHCRVAADCSNFLVCCSSHCGGLTNVDNAGLLSCNGGLSEVTCTCKG